MIRLLNKNLSAWVLAFFVVSPSLCFAGEAEIKGETYLGKAGAMVRIRLADQICTLKSTADTGIENFRIILICDGNVQVLWDINNPGENNLGFDDPKFELLWAGDLDKDNKIDLKLDMSPKYSCTRETIYLSTLAEDGELLGIKGTPENVCC